VVHEAPRTGDLGAEILARLHERGKVRGRIRFARVTGWDVPCPFPARDHIYTPDTERILDAFRRVLGEAEGTEVVRLGAGGML